MTPGVMIIGSGRVALALGYALRQAEAIDRLTICGRRSEAPTHPLFTQGLAEYVYGVRTPDPGVRAVFLAVSDDAIAEVAATLGALGEPAEECAAFHLSGVQSTEVLAPLHAAGYSIGSFHPLQAIAHPLTGAERLPGSWVAVTGHPSAVAVARGLASSMGCPVMHVPEQWRAQYHAAAVTAANYLPPLLDAACRMLEGAGVSHEEALPALLKLAEGSLANIRELGLEASVTGPVARGDVETIGLHLRALEGEDRALYTTFGRALTRLVGPGLSEDAKRALMERFEEEEGS
jgi:predicted short-subunit dehydrogenase-like oxidoreductase (DUF2520 family)